VFIKAYAYILRLGAEGLREVSENAVINANYLMNLVKKNFTVKYPGPCMHEFVASSDPLREYGVKTLDVAKRLLDLGVHAPTVYFPLIVSEALMIEPVETEKKETLDQFASLLERVATEAAEDPQVLKDAPVNTPVRRLDEVRAARNPDFRWSPDGNPAEES
jgi:glycine dehydrogenase subunit 2